MQPFAGRGRLFLLRHGETEWNRARRVMGRTAVPLSDAGREQVRLLTPHLEGLGIGAIWTSPLARARETAEILAAALGGLPVHDEEGLTEVHYAAWEGRHFHELVREPEFELLRNDPVRTAIPGGGESLEHVRDRVFPALERVLAASGGKPALVVSHGDPLRVVLAACLALDLLHLRRLRLDNGALSALELTGDWVEVKFVNMRPDLAAMIG
ncbi:MAG: histidine phosphatase family protein [Deltaproteobacteria bacterium]|nr:histidine phosphatase family protein [Deltaproteobacteria bacterium]